MHEILNIILEREPNSERAVLSISSDELSSDVDGAQARSITAAQHSNLRVRLTVQIVCATSFPGNLEAQIGLDRFRKSYQAPAPRSI